MSPEGRTRVAALPEGVRKTRVIDRLYDRYEERVIDPETGAILYEHAEPLFAHQGHGSAKTRPASH
jgi:hypothetical protein